MIISNISQRIRNLVNDNGKPELDTFIYGVSSIFTLTETATSVTSVLVNGTTSGVNYTLDTSNNTLTITSALSAGDVVVVTYIANTYSDTELKGYIGAALSFCSMHQYKYFEMVGENILPIPELKDLDLIAGIVYMILMPDYSSYHLPNLTVSYPRTLSKEKKIEDLIKKFKYSIGITDTLIDWRRRAHGAI